MKFEFEIEDEQIKAAVAAVIAEKIGAHVRSYSVQDAISNAVGVAIKGEVQRMVLAAVADSESVKKTIAEELRAKLSRQIAAAMKAA